MKRVLIALAVTVSCCVLAGCKKIYHEPEVSGFNSEGASMALFSVAPDRQVRFSRGNLQYNPKSNKWRFAEHQYNIIGKDNRNISANYDGWIDLFGWGTSGCNWGSTAYQPWSTSTTASDYFTERGDNDLTGEYAQGDWGVHNAITNGGNQAGKWRTLTAEEWRYLVSSNQEGPRHNRCCMAKIKFGLPMGDRSDEYDGYMGYENSGEIYGLIILPDNWTRPSSLNNLLIDPAESEYGPFINRLRYDLEGWHALEEAGAVFLPMTMYREGNVVNEAPGDPNSWCGWTEPNGLYWSSTCANSECAKAFQLFYWRKEDGNPYFLDSWSSVLQKAIGDKEGHLGLAVRLVQDR